MNKQVREDKLLNTSISEFLLLFLFIFLAIASIHRGGPHSLDTFSHF